MQDRQTYMQTYREAYKERKRRVTITMEVDEFEAFQQSATQTEQGSPEDVPPGLLMGGAKISVPEHIKQLALAQLNAVAAVPPIPPVNQALAEELRLLLRNMANNINQIAHNMHLNRHLYGPEANRNADRVVESLHGQLANLEEELYSMLTLHSSPLNR